MLGCLSIFSSDTSSGSLLPLWSSIQHSDSTLFFLMNFTTTWCKNNLWQWKCVHSLKLYMQFFANSSLCFSESVFKKNYQHLTLCFLFLLMVIIINIKFDEILTRVTVMYLLLINFSSGQLYKSKCPFADGIKGVVLDVKQPSPCWDPIITIVLHPIILLSSFLNIPIMLYFWIRTGFVSQKLKFSCIILYNL